MAIIGRKKRTRDDEDEEAPIPHVAVPVRDLEEARKFYVDVLGCESGRETDEWIDVWFFGCQVTLHLRPNEVLPAVIRGVRHFGVSLPPSQWSWIINRCRDADVSFVDGPRSDEGGAYKAKLEDPSGNVIEVKSYSDVRSALNLP